jgi:hypothetical protein
MLLRKTETLLTMSRRMCRSCKRPYGDVAYADPGYQEDGKMRYPIDTLAHAQAARRYINMPRNAAKYTNRELEHISERIDRAHAWFVMARNKKL